MESSAELTEIQYSYRNKTVFLTGLTSFVGKLLLEKILRLLPVKRVYVLVRDKDGVAAETRCAVTLDSPAFTTLKRTDPEFFKKVVLVEGDLEKPNLGLRKKDKDTIVKEVDCIFHCGLRTRIDENLKKAILINVVATKDLLNLAKQMEQLSMFVVLSTAYSNFPSYEIHEKIYETKSSAEELIKLCETSAESDIEKMREKLLGDWPDEYTFTMNVVEDFLKREEVKSLPVSVIRPSLLLPAAKEPMTGFIDKAFGLPANSMYHALGANRVNYFRNVTMDAIPVDYVVSLMIAAGWQCGIQKLRLKRGDVGSMELNVYHCISSQEKPITTNEWFGVNHTVFRDVPTSKMIQLPMQFNTSCYYNYKLLILVLHYCMAFLCDLGLKFAGKAPMIVDMYNRIHKSEELLSPYVLKEWYFSNDNTQKLLKKMTFKDRELFNFDIFYLNWQTYISSYARGIRVYLLNDSMSTLAEGKTKQQRKLVIQLVSAAVLVTILYVIAKFLLFRVIL